MIWIVNIFIFEEWLVVVLSARLVVLLFFVKSKSKIETFHKTTNEFVKFHSTTNSNTHVLINGLGVAGV